MQKNHEEKGRIEILVNLVNDDIITCSEAAKRVGMSKEEFMEKYLKKDAK